MLNSIMLPSLQVISFVHNNSRQRNYLCLYYRRLCHARSYGLYLFVWIVLATVRGSGSLGSLKEAGIKLLSGTKPLCAYATTEKMRRITSFIKKNEMKKKKRI